MRTSALVAALTAAAAAVPAAAAPTAGPSLRLTDRSPVTARGSAFVPQELVSVRLAARGRSWTLRARATSAGTVRVRFTISVGRCERVALQAFGSEGSRARLVPTSPQPDCVPTGGSGTG